MERIPRCCADRRRAQRTLPLLGGGAHRSVRRERRTLARFAWDIDLAIRRWDQATPDHPTAWMDDVTSKERDRRLDARHHAPDAAARCLPWLPEADAANFVDRIKREYLRLALSTSAAASPIFHAHHGGILSTLIQRAKPYDLAASSLRCRHRPLPSHLRRSQAAPKRHHLRCTRGPQRIRRRKRQQSQRDRMTTSQIDA
jgi:hypothetical protein